MIFRSFQPENETALVLAAVLDASDDAIVVKDLSNTILSWNRGAERMYGYSAEEAVGQSIALIVPPDRAEELDTIAQRVTAGERVGPYDTVRVTRSGYRLDVELTVVPMRDASGGVVGSVATTRDLTAQRRAEQALRRSESRSRAIVETAVDGIILIDRRGQIEFFNPAAERMFGFTEQEMIGRNVSTLMPEPYASEHDHYMKRYLMTGERRIIGIGREVTARRKDGSTFPVHLSVAELVLDGEVRFTGIVRDLTERVSLEKRLQEESALARIGELAAVLAHEVKNPLAAVSGAIQMLRGHLPDTDQEIVGEILKRLDGLGALMTDLLIYARPPRPKLTDVDISELLHGLVGLLQSDPACRNLTVHIEGQIGRVSADPELLKVAFQNLLLNAAQAMRGRGQISVRILQADDTAHVDIEDAGSGIPPDVQAKLFTPFFTTKARGTGLGLATVRRIVETHGGQVKVRHSTSDGTTMRVSLPLSKLIHR